MSEKQTVDTQHSDTYETVGVCHPNWRGIKSATYSLVPKVFEVPEIDSYADAIKIAQDINTHQPKKVILSGYPRGYHLLAKALKEVNTDVRVFFISHAPFTWYINRETEVSWLKDMFEAYNNGYIEKIGFVKMDPYVYFKEKGINAFFLLNRPASLETRRHILNREKPQVGVWGSEMWHRNLLNQTIGGLMIKNSTVHVNELSEYFFLDNSRLERHGVLPKEEYIPILNSMDVNLYISFTDCFPMTIIESISYGIPCLASDTSHVFHWSEYLKNNLIVSKVDSPVAIKEKIEWVFEHYIEVQEEIERYLPILNAEIEKSIKEFLK